MATIIKGTNSYSATISPGRTLTVAVPSGSSANVKRTPSGGTLAAVLVRAGETRTFGPYQVTQQFEVSVQTGLAEVTEGIADATLLQSVAVPVSVSRDLNASDNGQTLECTATVTLTVPTGLPAGFQCAILPSGTTSIASGGGTLLNGATSTLTRADSSNAVFAIIGLASAANSYKVSGS